MESYVERWKREKEEARYRKDVSNNGRKRKARKDGGDRRAARTESPDGQRGTKKAVRRT